MRHARVLATVMVLALWTAQVWAQAPSSRAGVLGGINFSDLAGKDVEESSSLTGFFGGGFLELALSRNFAIAPEVLYSMKGAKNSEGGTEVKVKLGYVEVPVLLKVMFPSGKEGKWAVRPHLYAGPAIAFKTSCKVSGEEGGVSVDVDCDEFADEFEIKGTDFSGVLGAGVDIGNLLLGVRYDFGFTKISQLPDGGDDDVKNRVLSIYAGFGFRLSK